MPSWRKGHAKVESHGPLSGECGWRDRLGTIVGLDPEAVGSDRILSSRMTWSGLYCGRSPGMEDEWEGRGRGKSLGERC